MNIDLNQLQQLLLQAVPILILCAGALLCLLVDAIWPEKVSLIVYAIGIITLVASFISACVAWGQELVVSQAVQNHFPILIIDQFTLFFMLLVTLIGIFSLLSALGYIKIHQTLTSEFCSLVLFAVIGMVFLFASDHLIVNFIGLETMSLAVYVLVGSHKKNLRSNEAAMKYFVMGGVASAIMLYGIALFYGSFGTFHLIEISVADFSQELIFLRNISIALVLVGVFFKIAVVPFHFWAPDVYEGAPAPVTGFMATGVKVAAFAFLIRFIALLHGDIPHVQTLLSVIVVLTLVVSTLLAVIQTNLKRMLAYSSISHAGFLVFGLLAGFENGVYVKAHAEVLAFYLLGYTFMSLGAFSVLSLLVKSRHEATDISDLRGLAAQNPVLAGVFSLFLISMAGIPPLVGFAIKYNVIALAVKNGHLEMAILAVLASVVAVFYYLRPIVSMYFGSEQENKNIGEIPLTTLSAISFCVVLVIGIGLRPDAFIQLSRLAVSMFR